MARQVIEISQLRKEMFMPVVQMRDMARARLVPVEEKKKMGLTDRDVMVESSIHGRRLISRRELVGNFRELNNRAIRLRGWKSGKTYNILGASGVPAFAMKVPQGYELNFKGKRIPGGKAYLVCRVGESGEPVVMDAQVIRRDRFRRMFSMPMSDQLRASLDGKTATYVTKEVPKNEVMPIPDIPKPTYKPMTPITPEDAVNKYMILGLLVDIEDRAVGYVVRDPKGKVLDLTEANVMRLAARKMLGNATLVVDQATGRNWLRGVGVQLKEMPKKKIDC